VSALLWLSVRALAMAKKRSGEWEKGVAQRSSRPDK